MGKLIQKPEETTVESETKFKNSRYIKPHKYKKTFNRGPPATLKPEEISYTLKNAAPFNEIIDQQKI